MRELVQNTNAYEVGFTAAWDGLCGAYWKTRAPEGYSFVPPVRRFTGSVDDALSGRRHVLADAPTQLDCSSDLNGKPFEEFRRRHFVGVGTWAQGCRFWRAPAR